MIKNYLLNEGYKECKIFYDKGYGPYIFHKNNKYLDLSSSGGTLLLGYNHAVLKNSIKTFQKNNFANFAAPNKFAQQFSKSIKKILPQFDKFILCNSGAEANIKALRICRAVTKKNKIAIISGSWHGSADQLLFTLNNKNSLVPISDGVDPFIKNNVIIIPNNNYEKSIKLLTKNLNQICCIIAEPIQGCLPDKKNVEYLKKINQFCKKNNLIFLLDEIISGLRFKDGSLQKLINIHSDVSTFGKCFGSGMPLGFIGISKKISKQIEKNKLKIFFGGTFSGNSLSMFIGNEFLSFFIKNKKKNY